MASSDTPTSARPPHSDWRQFHVLSQFASAARAILSPMAWSYFHGGADAQLTRRKNARAYARWDLWPRVLVDVSRCDPGVTLLGERLATPLIVAPMAYQKLAHPDGEIATARGAEAAGARMTVATLATISVEDVAAATPAAKWFQLYVHKDRGFTRTLVERARDAGYRGLVLTVDVPVLGRRLGSLRSAFRLPDGMTMANLGASPDLHEVAARHDASLGWKDLEWLASLSGMPILVKGILRGDDAARAADSGVAGIVVSNHGGRQLDGAPATLDALPGVLDAVAGRCPVLIDGGIRWGSDVLKALALGATAVMIGRPVLWGLACGGADGVARVLGILTEELVRAMALAGCPDLASIPRDLCRRGSP